MKILVSAIACTPVGGSEGAVGWDAVQIILKTHEVHLLTCASLKNDWDHAESENLISDRLKVRFIGKNKPWHHNRLIARFQSWWRYLRFNRQVLNEALRWHQEDPVDLIHQITYATWRVPSPLWKIPLPFVWGPIGGTAKIPTRFLTILSPSALLLECIRSIQTSFACRSSSFQKCMTHADVVIAANEETEEFLKPYRGLKPLMRLPIAYLSSAKVKRLRSQLESDSLPRGKIRIFAGGNIEGRKGVSLAIRALAIVRDAGVDFHYLVAGGGPEIENLRRLASSLGLTDRIEFHPGFKGDEFVRVLQESEIYLLPSFRETTPVTLQEAILAGCYPIVADASAAGEMTRMVGGCAVKADSPSEMVQGLAKALIHAASNRDSLHKRGHVAADKIADFYSAERFQAIIAESYEKAMTSKQANL